MNFSVPAHYSRKTMILDDTGNPQTFKPENGYCRIVCSTALVLAGKTTKKRSKPGQSF